MPRSARRIYQREIYHILNRGNARQNLFSSSEDFTAYLSLIARYKVKYSVTIFHYCLMDNHTHFLMRGETSDEAITRLMHDVQTAYAGHYRKNGERTGHVFENRFKNFHIEKDSYLLECGRYIERNPVRAGMVKSPGLYLWSSFRYYAFGAPDPLVTENPIYREMGFSDVQRRMHYIQYVETPRAYEAIVDQFFKEKVVH